MQHSYLLLSSCLFLDNFPPTLTGAENFRVTVGVSSIYTFTAIDTNDEEVTVTILGPPEEDFTLTQNGNSYTLSIAVEETFTYEITIVATDTMGTTATLGLLVEICGCQNEGTCTLNGTLGSNTNVVDMLCQCTPGM